MAGTGFPWMTRINDDYTRIGIADGVGVNEFIVGIKGFFPARW